LSAPARTAALASLSSEKKKQLMAKETTTMIHTKREWTVADVDTAEELALKLTQYVWTCCTGFRLTRADLLFLNDSFSEDGAQEYAVIVESTGRQVESVTFGWMSEARALALLRHYLAEKPDEPFGTIDSSRWQPAAHPGRCHLCA
jgi:hypothetical protein